MDLTTLTLTTPRLYLRPVCRSDAEAIFRDFTPEVTRYMAPTSPASIAGILAFIAESETTLREGKHYRVAILRGDDGAFLGCGGIDDVDTPTPELGIWIAKRHHRNGYGLEAVTHVFRWAQSRLRCQYVRYPVDRRNAPSRRIAEALGGTVQAETRFEKANGDLLELLEYRIDPGPSPRPPEEQGS